MDALSTTHPASSLLPKPFISTNSNCCSSHRHHPLHLLRPPPSSSSKTNPPHFSANNKANHSLKPTLPTSIPSSLSPPPTLTPPLQTHRRAATGYAAALLDAAYCDAISLRTRPCQGSIHPGATLAAVAKDARRVKRMVRAVLEDERVEGESKGEAVKRAVEGGGLYKKLVVLVKMLVRKGRVGAVEETMEEFGRLWAELCGIKQKTGGSMLVGAGEPRLAIRKDLPCLSIYNVTMLES